MVKVLAYVDAEYVYDKVTYASTCDFRNLTSVSSHMYAFRNDVYTRAAWIVHNRGGIGCSIMAVLDDNGCAGQHDPGRMLTLLEILVDRGGDVNMRTGDDTDLPTKNVNTEK